MNVIMLARVGIFLLTVLIAAIAGWLIGKAGYRIAGLLPEAA